MSRRQTIRAHFKAGIGDLLDEVERGAGARAVNQPPGRLSRHGDGWLVNKPETIKAKVLKKTSGLSGIVSNP
jgi:hypothetical protein